MAAIACVVQRKRGLKKVPFLRFHSKYSSQCLYKLVLRLKYSSVPRKSFLGGFFDQRIFDGSVVDLITSQLSFSERRHAGRCSVATPLRWSLRPDGCSLEVLSYLSPCFVPVSRAAFVSTTWYTNRCP